VQRFQVTEQDPKYQWLSHNAKTRKMQCYLVCERLKGTDNAPTRP